MIMSPTSELNRQPSLYLNVQMCDVLEECHAQLMYWTVRTIVLEKGEATTAGSTPVVIDPTNKIEIIIINPTIALIFFIGFNKGSNLLLALS